MPYLNNRMTISALFIMLLCAGFSTQLRAEEDLQAPQKVIQQVSSQIQEKFKDKAFTKNFSQVTEYVDSVIDKHADFDRIAVLVLGKNWKAATADEQSRFKKEFKLQIVRVYSRAFVEYNDWKLSFLPLEQSGEKTKVLVKTEVLQPDQPAVEVNYRMFSSHGDWKVYDIIIGGVSLITNYRASYNEEIQRKGSLSALIDEIAKSNADALKAKGR